MSRVEIFFSEDSEYTEFYAPQKGWRGDIWVKIDQNAYNISAFIPLRLQQDFDHEIGRCGHYFPDPNLIFVKETSKAEIISTINWLAEQGYFSGLKCLESLDTDALVKVQ